MNPDEKALRERVQAIMPDLEVRRFDVNRDGLINDVAVVNDELVFRFAKTEESARILDTEMKILDLIREDLGVAVPAPFHRQADCVVYPYLPGRPLTRQLLLELDDTDRLRLAGQLGGVLARLHATRLDGLDWEVPTTLAPVSRARWLDLRARIQNKVYPLLLPHQLRWAEDLLSTALGDPTFFDYSPALIHGDLASYHILYDERSGDIGGLIDFGVAGRGDPALDFGNLITSYGERFVALVGRAYARFTDLLPRARFYAQSIELQWVLLGLETGEDFWFTAHLGGARDVGF